MIGRLLIFAAVTVIVFIALPFAKDSSSPATQAVSITMLIYAAAIAFASVLGEREINVGIMAQEQAEEDGE
jgi:hypothetical protein